MKTLKISLLIISIGLLINSCKKENPDPRHPTPYYIRMTDAPAAYSAVNVDIQAVEVRGEGRSVMLNVNAGVYNLLNFTNGLDTLIANGLLYINRVEQIRLILGNNNSVVSGGITYALKTPSAQQSGLKIQVHQMLQAGVPHYVLLDFDANQSIVAHGNGDYSLKPVIKAIEVAASGSIKGQINPSGVAASVVVTSGSDSRSTTTNINGEFMFTGLPTGVYDVTITPASPYNPSTVNNITVTAGGMINMGTINL